MFDDEVVLNRVWGRVAYELAILEGVPTEDEQFRHRITLLRAFLDAANEALATGRRPTVH